MQYPIILHTNTINSITINFIIFNSKYIVLIKHPMYWVFLPLPKVRNLCTLKNKYDLTLCQSRLHTVSETFVRHNFFFKMRPGSISSVFAFVLSILIGKDDEYANTKHTYKIFWLSVQGPLHF